MSSRFKLSFRSNGGGGGGSQAEAGTTSSSSPPFAAGSVGSTAGAYSGNGGGGVGGDAPSTSMMNAGGSWSAAGGRTLDGRPMTAASAGDGQATDDREIGYAAFGAADGSATAAAASPHTLVDSDAPLFGLENFGNTCYANSVLQVLYHCPPFRRLAEAYPNPTPASIPLGPDAAALAHAANGGESRASDAGFQWGSSSVSSAMTTPTGMMDGAAAATPPTPTPAPTATSKPNGSSSRWSMMGRKNSSNLLEKSAPAAAAATTPPPLARTNTQPNILSQPAPPSNGPPPSLLSTIQALFEYLETSPTHPPPPPKAQLPAAAGATSGGTTVTLPTAGLAGQASGPFVRGGGPHGAGTLGRGICRPEELVRTVRRENELFRSMMHQDAHEFLGWTLNKVAEDVEALEKKLEDEGKATELPERTPLSGKTFVHTLFEGVLTNETRCLTCETISNRDEAFLDLSIDIEQNTSVTSCLRQFSASEMLCQKNKFFCEICCGLQEAEKRMKVKKLPNILALHLKRFKYQEQYGRYMKLAYRVVFPLQLRLFNTSDDVEDPDRLYELFAVIIHIGIGPNQGHYVAIVRNQGRWVLCDDENVEPIAETDIPRYFGDLPAGAGYVLFYQAVDLDLAALGLKTPAPAPVTKAATPPTAGPVQAAEYPTPNTPLFAPGVELMVDEPSPDETVTSPKLRVEAALAEYQRDETNVSPVREGRSRGFSGTGHISDTSAKSTPTSVGISSSQKSSGGWLSRRLKGDEEKKKGRPSTTGSIRENEAGYDDLGMSIPQRSAPPPSIAMSPSSTMSLSAAGSSMSTSQTIDSNGGRSMRVNGSDGSPSTRAGAGPGLAKSPTPIKDDRGSLSRRLSKSMVPGLKRSPSSTVKGIFGRKSSKNAGDGFAELAEQ